MHDPIPEFLAHENIRRFEEQLLASADEDRKAVIRRLLEAERQHLRDIQKGGTA